MSDTRPVPLMVRVRASGQRRVAAHGVWIGAIVMLAVLPYVFSSRLSLTTLCLMGIMVIFALSYNMLLGQTGLLSFGHAVFFGMGGFFAVHAMNAVEAWGVPLPLVVIPIAGGAAGLLFGLVFGAIITRRSGTAFAMITLGVAELVSSGALILRTFFGGEAGISTDRTALVHPFGISFGPQFQLYYLVAGWCLLSVGGMYALTRTPFGRMCNAVRDNPERVLFIGYDTQRVRFIAFSLSGLFAGIAGALVAIDFELMSSSQLGVEQSGTVILATFIGGVGEFAGPIIGAVLVTYLQVTLRDLTDAWQLYFGLLFIFMVMFAPDGIAGALARQRPVLQAGQLHRVAPYYVAASLPALVAVVGLSMVIEMADQLTVHAADGPRMMFCYVPVSADAPLAWAVAGLLLAGGTWVFLRAAQRAKDAYDEALSTAHPRRVLP